MQPAWRGRVGALILALSVAACGGGSGGGTGSGSGSGAAGVGGSRPPPDPVCAERGALCADELLERVQARLSDLRHYGPAAGFGPALHDFHGVLEAAPITMSGAANEPSGRATFPGFETAFITVDDTLLPLDRGIQFGGRRDAWDLILSPGRVWSEPGDRGYSRAAFPFTLVWKQWNEAHNGVATFLYDDTRISRLRFQVTQETVPWNKLDLWGGTESGYTPGPVAGAEALAEDWRDELAGRVKTRPMARLGRDFPAADLRLFLRNIDPADVSATAILVDDTLYYRAATTRAGNYPFPLEMRHGVFSVTKSAAAALTLLRLAQKYGEQVFDLFVTDYLDVTADHDGWNGVTFGHLLSMTAGIGDRFPDPNAAATFADENDESSEVWRDTWRNLETGARLAGAFGYGDYPWAPGQVVRYNTAHTLILGAAMEAFYRAMAGPDADLWAMMEAEVFRPIGIRHLPTMKTTGLRPMPIWGFGLFLNAYDTARIVQLLQRDGVWDGVQLLHAESTRQSLSPTPTTGYPTAVNVPLDGRSQRARYLNSFWSFNLPGPGGCVVRVPYMWGFGGNFVVILPNGVSAFRYADGDVHDPGALGLAAATIRPIC